MKLRFKQRFFSWLDSYDIYNENGETVYTVEGKLNWGHCLHILDSRGEHLATLQEKILTFLPKFEIYLKDNCVGTIQKEFTFFRPRFILDFNGWQVEGDWMEWDYSIVDGSGRNIAVVTKELFQWTDTYTIDVEDPRNALCALLVVLAIDAEKCSRD